MTGHKEVFWGWYIVAGSFLVLAVTYGARYCFGVFVEPLYLENGWSRSVISLAATINLSIYSIGAIFVGRLLDRVAPRWIITFGALCAATGFILTTLVKSPFSFYLTYGVLVGLGAAGMGIVVCGSSVGKWFIKMRGTALGITTMGVGFGTVALIPLSGFLGKYFGWRIVMLILGIITLVIGVTVSQLLMRKTKPEDYGLAPDGDKTMSTAPECRAPAESKIALKILFTDSRFWTIAICQSLVLVVVMTVFVHQIPYAVEKTIDSVSAANSLATVSLVGFFSKLFFGWLSDRLRDPKYAFFLGVCFLICGMIVFNYADSIGRFYVFAVIFGFGYGFVAPVLPILIIDRFGRHVMGSTYGLLTSISAFIGILGPILGGAIYDLNGSYSYLWLVNVAILLIACLTILALKKDRPAT